MDDGMDRKLFNGLMAWMRPEMFRFALSFTGSADEAEDAVQEVVLRLWERSGELREVRCLKAYAMGAVRNRCMDSLRMRAVRRARVEEGRAAGEPADEQTPDRALEQADMAAHVGRLVDGLPEQQRSVMRLRDIEGYGLEEIAEIMDMSGGAVRTALSRARQKVRDELLKLY